MRKGGLNAVQTGARSCRPKAKPRPAPTAETVHPSWLAKRAQKAKLDALKGTNTKISFD